MPVRNIQRVKLNIEKKVGEIAGIKSERAIRSILQAARGYSDVLTPRATGNLLSGSLIVMLSPAHGRLLNKTDYAFWVHESKGLYVGKKKPRQGRLKGYGNYWDPVGAEPQFLVKGFEAIKPSIPALLKAAYGS